MHRGIQHSGILIRIGREPAGFVGLRSGNGLPPDHANARAFRDASRELFRKVLSRYTNSWRIRLGFTGIAGQTVDGLRRKGYQVATSEQVRCVFGSA